MFCQHCGFIIRDDSVVCANCGAEVQPTSSGEDDCAPAETPTEAGFIAPDSAVAPESFVAPDAPEAQTPDQAPCDTRYMPLDEADGTPEQAVYEAPVGQAYDQPYAEPYDTDYEQPYDASYDEPYEGMAYAQIACYSEPVYDYDPGVTVEQSEKSRSILIFGIIGLALSFTGITSIAGIIFSAIALKRAGDYAAYYGPLYGRSKVVKILGTVGLVISIIVACYFILRLSACVGCISFNTCSLMNELGDYSGYIHL